MSQNTGLASVLATAAKQDTIVKEGIITSSPFFNLSDCRTISSATEPLVTALLLMFSCICENSVSNF